MCSAMLELGIGSLGRLLLGIDGCPGFFCGQLIAIRFQVQGFFSA